jgi:hypothetical protein
MINVCDDGDVPDVFPYLQTSCLHFHIKSNQIS